MTRPFSRVIDAVAEIARKMGGTIVNKGDRLADSLEAIAEVAGSGGGGGGGAGHQIPATWSNGSVTLGEISVDDYEEICSDVAQNATPCYLAIDYGGGTVLSIALSSAMGLNLYFQDRIQTGSSAVTAKITAYEVYEADGSLNIYTETREFSVQ